MSTINPRDLQNNPMPRKEWDRVRSLAPQEILMHKSADAAMIPNPLLVANPQAMPKKIPWVGQGKTYNVGRNAAKRAAQARG